MMACQKGLIKIVKLLVEAGSNISLKNRVYNFIKNLVYYSQDKHAQI